MKKLAADMARRIAMRLKGTPGEGGAPGVGGERAAKAAESQVPRAPGGRRGENGSPDLQRMLSHLPNGTLADLQKGDAVMIVSTEGTDSGAVTAITLLAGGVALPTACPKQNATTTPSPCILGAGGGGRQATQA